MADPGVVTAAVLAPAPARTAGQASGAASGQAGMKPVAAPTMPNFCDEKPPLQLLPPPDGTPAGPLGPPANKKRKRNTHTVSGTVSCRLQVAYVLAL